MKDRVKFSFVMTRKDAKDVLAALERERVKSDWLRDAVVDYALRHKAARKRFAAGRRG